MATWVRSSRCDTGTCVEVAWARAGHRGGGECVEVGHTEDEVLMRDSKDPDGVVLRLTRDQWRQFIQSLKD